MFTLQNIGRSPSRHTTNYSRNETSTRCSGTRASTSQKKRTLDSPEYNPETIYTRCPILGQSHSTPNIKGKSENTMDKKKKMLQPKPFDVLPKMCTSYDIEEKCHQAIMHNKQNMEHNSDVLLTEHGVVRRSQIESLYKWFLRMTVDEKRKFCYRSTMEKDLTSKYTAQQY